MKLMSAIFDEFKWSILLPWWCENVCLCVLVHLQIFDHTFTSTIMIQMVLGVVFPHWMSPRFLPQMSIHMYVARHWQPSVPHASISVPHTLWVLVVQHMPILLSGWRRWCLHVSLCASVLDKLPTLWPLKNAKYQINALSVNLKSHCVRWQGSQFLDQHANCVLIVQHLSYAG